MPPGARCAKIERRENMYVYSIHFENSFLNIGIYLYTSSISQRYVQRERFSQTFDTYFKYTTFPVICH